MVNMLTESSFEGDLGGLTPSEGGLWEVNPNDGRSVRTVADAIHGTKVLVVTNTDGRANPNLQSEGRDYNACSEGDVLTGSIYVRVAAGSAFDVRLDVQFFDAADTSLGTDLGSRITPTAAFQRLATTSAPAPVGTAEAQIRLVMLDSGVLGDEIEVDAAQLELGSAPTAYAPNPNEEAMPFVATQAGINAAADGSAAAITHATLHNADPTVDAVTSRADSGAQATVATNSNGTITITAEAFTGPASASVTHAGLWAGDPDAGGTLLYADDITGDQSFNAAGEYDLTGFSITVS